MVLMSNRGLKLVVALTPMAGALAFPLALAWALALALAFALASAVALPWPRLLV